MYIYIYIDIWCYSRNNICDKARQRDREKWGHEPFYTWWMKEVVFKQRPERRERARKARGGSALLAAAGPGRGGGRVLWSMTRRPLKGDGEADTLPGVRIMLRLGGHVWTLRVQAWSENLRLFQLQSLHDLLCPERLLRGSEAARRQTPARKVLPSTVWGVMGTRTRGFGSGGARCSGFQSSGLCGLYVKGKSKRWLSGFRPKKPAG